MLMSRRRRPATAASRPPTVWKRTFFARAGEESRPRNVSPDARDEEGPWEEREERGRENRTTAYFLAQNEI